MALPEVSIRKITLSGMRFVRPVATQPKEAILALVLFCILIQHLQVQKSEIQWNTFGTPLFSGHLHSGDTNCGSQKNGHIIFVSVTSIEETLIQGKGVLFSGDTYSLILNKKFKHYKYNEI